MFVPLASYHKDPDASPVQQQQEQQPSELSTAAAKLVAEIVASPLFYLVAGVGVHACGGVVAALMPCAPASAGGLRMTWPVTMP
jgi:hypothetical protein